jgi:hypothetical protein
MVPSIYRASDPPLSSSFEAQQPSFLPAAKSLKIVHCSIPNSRLLASTLERKEAAQLVMTDTLQISL